MRQVSQQTHCTRLGLLSGSVAKGPVYGGPEVQIWVGREQIWWRERKDWVRGEKTIEKN